MLFAQLTMKTAILLLQALDNKRGFKGNSVPSICILSWYHVADSPFSFMLTRNFCPSVTWKRMRNLHSPHRKTKITFFLPCCDLNTSGKTQTTLNKQWSRWLAGGFLETALQESAAFAQAAKRSHRFLWMVHAWLARSRSGSWTSEGDNASNKQRHLLQLLDLTSSQWLLRQKTGLGWAGTPSCGNTRIC